MQGRVPIANDPSPPLLNFSPRLPLCFPVSFLFVSLPWKGRVDANEVRIGVGFSCDGKITPPGSLRSPPSPFRGRDKLPRLQFLLALDDLGGGAQVSFAADAFQIIDQHRLA